MATAYYHIHDSPWKRTPGGTYYLIVFPISYIRNPYIAACLSYALSQSSGLQLAAQKSQVTVIHCNAHERVQGCSVRCLAPVLAYYLFINCNPEVGTWDLSYPGRDQGRSRFPFVYSLLPCLWICVISSFPLFPLYCLRFPTFECRWTTEIVVSPTDDVEDGGKRRMRERAGEPPNHRHLFLRPQSAEFANESMACHQQ